MSNGVSATSGASTGVSTVSTGDGDLLTSSGESVTTSDRLTRAATTEDRLLSAGDGGTVSRPAQAAGLVDDSDRGALQDSCLVEARFNTIGSGYTHAYVTTTDLSGTDFFRAGPSGSGPAGGSSGVISSGGGGSSTQALGSDSVHTNNTGNGSSPGSGPGGPDTNVGPYGAIDTTSGPYAPGTVDWNPGTPPITTVAVEPGNCDVVEDRLNDALDDIESANIPYNPFSTNSNAVAREILERAGYPDVESAAWAPGWNTQLR